MGTIGKGIVRWSKIVVRSAVSGHHYERLGDYSDTQNVIYANMILGKLGDPIELLELSIFPVSHIWVKHDESSMSRALDVD